MDPIIIQNPLVLRTTFLPLGDFLGRLDRALLNKKTQIPIFRPGFGVAPLKSFG